jgi:XTP/dITP diphosphohydrolase
LSGATTIARLKPGGTLVVATHNQGKLGEFLQMLAPYELNLRSAGELGLPEPEETGGTFEQNALAKAFGAMMKSSLPAIGDDSGLVVDALGGQPGIYSARWAGSGRDRDFGRAMRNVQEKLAAAGATTPEQRRAKFVAVIAYVEPGGHGDVFRGEVEGQLVWPPRGDRGFGYDPMFVPDGDTRTFAEFEPGEKDRMSHRARAVAAFAAKVLA